MGGFGLAFALGAAPLVNNPIVNSTVPNMARRMTRLPGLISVVGCGRENEAA